MLNTISIYLHICTMFPYHCYCSNYWKVKCFHLLIVQFYCWKVMSKKSNWASKIRLKVALGKKKLETPQIWVAFRKKWHKLTHFTLLQRNTPQISAFFTGFLEICFVSLIRNCFTNTQGHVVGHISNRSKLLSMSPVKLWIIQDWDFQHKGCTFEVWICMTSSDLTPDRHNINRISLTSTRSFPLQYISVACSPVLYHQKLAPLNCKP